MEELRRDDFRAAEVMPLSAVAARAEDGMEPRITPNATPVRSLSVVIPVYNEEELLSSTVRQVLTVLSQIYSIHSFEIILSENGSRDSTRDIAWELATRYPEVKLVARDEADYGAAMRAGFLEASGDVIVNFDADYYDFDFLRRALEIDADIVVAAKSIAGSQDTRTILRRVVSRSFGWFVRSLLGLETRETHGMKLFHGKAIQGLLPDVSATKDLFDTELIARAEWTGLRIKELPVRTKEMRHSRSGIVRRIPRTIWGLLRMRYRLRHFHSAGTRRTRRTRRTPRPLAKVTTR